MEKEERKKWRKLKGYFYYALEGSDRLQCTVLHNRRIQR